MDKKFVEKALIELNESEEKRIQSLNQFRKWLDVHPFLKNMRRDDVYLLLLLRFKKFRIDDAFKFVEKSFLTIFKHLEILNFGDQNYQKMMKLYETGYMVPTSQRNAEGQKIVFVRFSKWDPDIFSAYDCFRLIYYVFSVLIEEEETQIAGVSVVMDCANLTMKHLVGPVFLNHFSSTAKINPIRFKMGLVLNLPPFAKVLVDLITKILSEKVGMRIATLNDPSKLKDHIDSSLLLEEYGGTLNIDEEMKKFLTLEKQKNELAMSAYKLPTTWDKSVLNIVKNKTSDDVVGSFQKLDFD